MSDYYNQNQYGENQYGENQNYDNGQYQEQRGYVNQEEEEGNRNIFVEEDGSVDKSRVFMAGVGALAAGLIGKKIYNHYKEDDEENQAAQGVKPVQFYDAQGRPIHQLKGPDGEFIEQDLYNADGTPVDPSFIDKLRNFFMDPDGSVDKSTVFWSVLAATATAYAGKRIYDNFNEEEQQDQYAKPPQFFDAEGKPIHQLKGPDGQLIEQPMYNADGTPVDEGFVHKLRNYFMDPDGSPDCSHIIKVLAGTAAVGYGGKMAYDHYNNRNEETYGRRDLDEGY
ncbi:hypothetical protein FB645_003970 [Coemansia sp. IMI 203386]|nr:hypothetical protein FB645_003970 [Coemansia sp. IMI 203386]